MSKNERQGLLWILLAAAGYAFIPTMVKSVYDVSTFEPLDIAIWRFMIAVPLMWILVSFRRRSKLPRKSPQFSRLKVLLLGLVFAADVLSALFALERLPASIYVVLLYTYPAMVVMISFLTGEVIRPRAWFALALAILGVGLTVPNIFAATVEDKMGVALALVNAAGVALFFLMSRRIMKNVEDVSAASATMMFGTLIVFALWIPVRGLQLPQDPGTIFGLLSLALIGTVLPLFATNVGIQKIGASQASLVSTVEPVIAMIVSMIILGEIILGVQWLGAALIVGSVIVLQLRPRNKVDLSIAHEAG